MTGPRRAPKIDFIIAAVIGALTLVQFAWMLTRAPGHALVLPAEPLIIPLGGLTGVAVAICWLVSGLAFRTQKRWAWGARGVAIAALVALTIASGPLTAALLSATVHRWISG